MTDLRWQPNFGCMLRVAHEGQMSVLGPDNAATLARTRAHEAALSKLRQLRK